MLRVSLHSGRSCPLAPLSPSLDHLTCLVRSSPCHTTTSLCSHPLRPRRHSSCQDTHSDAPHSAPTSSISSSQKCQASSTPSSSRLRQGRLLVRAPGLVDFPLFPFSGIRTILLLVSVDHRPLWPRVSSVLCSFVLLSAPSRVPIPFICPVHAFLTCSGLFVELFTVSMFSDGHSRVQLWLVGI